MSWGYFQQGNWEGKGKKKKTPMGFKAGRWDRILVGKATLVIVTDTIWEKPSQECHKMLGKWFR